MPLIRTDVPIQALLKRFALIYLPIVIVFFVVLLIGIRLDEQKRVGIIEARENYEIDLVKTRVRQDFEEVDSDLRIIAKLPLLQHYLDSGGTAQRDELAKLFLVIAREKGHLDKLRYLDESGQEVIRINYNDGKPAIVPHTKMQKKLARYFFHDTFKLNQGEVYVSPLDLNVEENRLEIPYKPTIRFGTPVFDSAGHKKGILLFNYLGNYLLQDLHKVMRGIDHSVMLLNRDGYWLFSNTNHADEWGFMLGKNDRTFGHDFADEWRTISTSEGGMLLTAKGLFIYGTVHPLISGEKSSTGSNLVRGSSQHDLTAQEYKWKIVSFVPIGVLSGAAFYNQTSDRIWLVMGYLLLSLAALAIAFVIISRKQARADLRIAATAFESQEGMLVTDANRVILRVNRAFTNITGYPAEEVIGKNPHILSSGRQDANFYAAMWESINNTGAWEGEIWNRRKNGEVYPEQLTITAVKDKNGTVTNYVATLNDITMSNEAADKIKNLAFYDPLTGLPNRRLLLDRLHQAFASSERGGREGALLFIDLDNVKSLNDTLGHDIGDLLLQQTAQRLESCLREVDTVARLGGDEFVVMLEGLSEHALEAATQTKTVGEKILATLNQPYQLDTHEYHSIASIGATMFSDHGQSEEELLKQADIAMYQAKKAGRNTLRFFNPQMQVSITGRFSLEGELRKALGNKEFQLYYQIQVDSSHRPLGAEALIRWIHPLRGMVSPAQFIPLAEETGLILPIGQWVLETACTQLKAWEQEVLTRDLVLAVNVSAKQFRQADFVAQVQAAVQHHAINPMRLKLELTEGMLLENIEDTIATMNALKEIGIQFSLDDFGTGYSSLQYLKRLPLNQIKIDQSFVRNLATDSGDKAVVRAIIAMAQSLNLDVIAEGVETEEQRQLLLGKGCTHYQGYLISKPVPIEQFEALLKIE